MQPNGKRKPWSTGRQRVSRQGRAIQIQRLVADQDVPRATKELDGGRVSGNMVRQVLAFRAQTANQDGLTFIGKRKVAELLNVAQVDVQRADRALVRVGLLEPTSPPPGVARNVTCYRVPMLTRHRNAWPTKQAARSNDSSPARLTRPGEGRAGIAAGQPVARDAKDSTPRLVSAGQVVSPTPQSYYVAGASCETPSLPLVGRDVTPPRDDEEDPQSTGPGSAEGRAERAPEAEEVAPCDTVGIDPAPAEFESFGKWSKNFFVVGESYADRLVRIGRRDSWDEKAKAALRVLGYMDGYEMRGTAIAVHKLADDEDLAGFADFVLDLLEFEHQ